MARVSGTLTLIGSGEFGDAMGRVYRHILARAPSEPHAVFVDTPAGFEVNADALGVKAQEYFTQRLNLRLEISSYKHKERASAVETVAAVHALRRADLIIAGPGSPSYVVRNWRDSQVWATILDRFQSGAQLVFASAAAIAAGTYALPVYEIFKAGAEAYWLEGLDIFAALGINLAVVPHWNNNEGATFDTRYCFMGAERFTQLEQLLGETAILGIDEHTACHFDLASEECQVFGVGSITIRCNGNEWSYPSGARFPFAQLRSPEHRRSFDPASSPAPKQAPPADEMARYLMQVALALDETREQQVKSELIARAHDTMHELSVETSDTAHSPAESEIAPFVELLIEFRNTLRERQEYALADEIRTRLVEYGVVLEDGPNSTLWHRL